MEDVVILAVARTAIGKFGGALAALSAPELIESNEAVAAKSPAVSAELERNSERLNVNGGAIALGHPIGAFGARVPVTLLGKLVHSDLHKGLATLCIGGGQGAALTVER